MFNYVLCRSDYNEVAKVRRKIENFPDKTIFHLLVNKFTFRGIKEVSANVYLDTDSF